MNITLATYVWQPTTVAAMNNIVASWNKANPSIQVSIVPVDVNSVHDKLLTSFVGGTSADIVHDEAADIPSFTQAGYLANLNSGSSRASLKSSIPQSLWNTVNFGRKNGITGVPIMCQTYNVFANMTLLKAAGIKAPTAKARGPGISSARPRRSSARTATSASAGASSRRPRPSRRWA